MPSAEKAVREYEKLKAEREKIIISMGAIYD